MHQMISGEKIMGELLICTCISILVYIILTLFIEELQIVLNTRKFKYYGIDPELLDLVFDSLVVISAHIWTPNREVDEDLLEHHNFE